MRKNDNRGRKRNLAKAAAAFSIAAGQHTTCSHLHMHSQDRVNDSLDMIATRASRVRKCGIFDVSIF